MAEATITSASRRFRAIRALTRLMLRSQYRRIEVEGEERMPETGAVMIVANHFRSLMDPMALLHASPRPASFLAKAPLWKTKPLAFFLDGVGALPVYRPQDVSENEGRSTRANLETFRVCRERLQEGGSIALFPEGVSQPRPRLMEVRTGAARIALDAKVPVTICPTALVFEPALRGRRGTLLVSFGTPFTVEGWDAYDSRRAAITGVTRRIERELRELLAECDTEADLESIRTLRLVWEQERDVPRASTLQERHRRTRYFARGLEQLKEVDPDQVDDLRAGTETYVQALQSVGIPPEHLRGNYTGKKVARFLLLRMPIVLLTAPIAIAASVATWPIRRVGDIVALRMWGGSDDVRVLCRLLGGSMMLVFVMVLGALLVGALWSWWGALAVFLGLPALLFLHIYWQDRTIGARASIHSFFLLAGANLRTELQKQRRALFRRLEQARDRLREVGAEASIEEE